MVQTILSILIVLIIAGGVWAFRWQEQERRETEKASIEELLNREPAPKTDPEIVPIAEEAAVGAAPIEEKKPLVPTTAPATLSVKVLNGGAPKGSAGTIQAFLKTNGYAKALASNSVGDYQGVTVYYQEGKQADAEAVKQVLLKKYPTVNVLAGKTGTETAVTPVVVILGK